LILKHVLVKKLVIFGVGLIGGSVALALKSNKVALALKKAAKCNHSVTHIVGVGRTQESLQNALDLGVIDTALTNVGDAIQDADLILIAAPVAQTASILQSIKPHLNSNTVITDAGSTKSDVLIAARAILGEQFSQFVGGHPIAGAEKSGVSAAKADLFLGKNVVLTPALETNIHAVRRVSELWKSCGANVSEMPAETHDSIFAAVSHLPHLLAFALVDDIAARPNAEQLFSPEMWRDISLANKTALLSEINAFENELSQLKQLLKNDDANGLQALFERASVARNNWAHGIK
jgi:prephenate dehydrogenase